MQWNVFSDGSEVSVEMIDVFLSGIVSWAISTYYSSFWIPIKLKYHQLGRNLMRLSQALDDKRKPIPPTEELLEFFVADDVTS